MSSELVEMTWRWCSKCPNRKVDVVKHDFNMFMGVDTCGAVDGAMYVNPSMKAEVGKWCPFYAEAMVEQFGKDDRGGSGNGSKKRR